MKQQDDYDYVPLQILEFAKSFRLQTPSIAQMMNNKFIPLLPCLWFIVPELVAQDFTGWLQPECDGVRPRSAIIDLGGPRAVASIQSVPRSFGRFERLQVLLTKWHKVVSNPDFADKCDMSSTTTTTTTTTPGKCNPFCRKPSAVWCHTCIIYACKSHVYAQTNGEMRCTLCIDNQHLAPSASYKVLGCSEVQNESK